jgi:hypothetical protein
MATARPQIGTHLLTCYHAFFGLDTLLAIDPSSPLRVLLNEWQRFERGHFEGGRRISTLTDFRDNFPYVLGLFRGHDFFREYHTRYRLHPRYRPTPSAHAAATLAVDRLQLLHSMIVVEGPHYVDIQIGYFLEQNPTDLPTAGRAINAYFEAHDYRTAFTDASSSVNRQLDFDDSEVLRYDTTSQENAPPPPPAEDTRTQHAHLALLLSKLAALHEA